jgi:hypothetical protein
VASLRDVFDALIGQPRHDPAEVLREQGFDLPATATADALVSYAHSAPVEVASHLQQFVMAHGPVPPAAGGDTEATAETGDGLGLLATAPVVMVPDVDAPSELDATAAHSGDAAFNAQPAVVAGSAATVTADELDFGSGGGEARAVAADADAGRADAAAADAGVEVPVPDGSAPDPYDLDAGLWPDGPSSADSGDAAAAGDTAAGADGADDPWDSGQF